jgi:hypothetical protein
MPWRVRLVGDVDVLHSLVNEIDGDELAIFAESELDEFFLTSTTLDQEERRSVAEKVAATLVGRISGVARLLVDDLDIDTRLQVKTLDQVAVTVARRTDRPRVRHGCRWLERAEREPGFGRELELVGAGVYWDDAAEVRRIIATAIGGEHRFVELGIASAHELHRLVPKRTGTPLPRSIELLVLRIVNRWIVRG